MKLSGKWPWHKSPATEQNAATPTAAPGAYSTLKELVALRYRAQGFSFLPRQPIHSMLAGRHASRLRGRGLNFEEIRRYQAGDDIRQIDWRATARTRKTHSRVYTEERERTTLLLVDQRAAMFFGSIKRMKSTTAAEACALAAWRVLAQQDRVGALVFNDTDIIEIRPQRSQSNVMRILHAVLQMNHALTLRSTLLTTGSTVDSNMLNTVLERCAQLAKHDCMINLISDCHGLDDTSRQLLTRISAHNDILVGFVFDPLEAELPAAGPLVFASGEQQLEVDTGHRGLRQRYKDDFAAARAAGRLFLQQREVPVIPLNTSEDVAEQVRRRLGHAIRQGTAGP